VAVRAALNAVDGMNAVWNGVQVWFAVRNGVRGWVYVVRVSGRAVASVPVGDSGSVVSRTACAGSSSRSGTAGRSWCMPGCVVGWVMACPCG
jgi:hypothetical protein